MIKITKKFHDDLRKIPKRESDNGSGISPNAKLIVVVCIKRKIIHPTGKYIEKIYEPLIIYFGIKDIVTEDDDRVYWIYTNRKSTQQGAWLDNKEFEEHFRMVQE